MSSKKNKIFNTEYSKIIWKKFFTSTQKENKIKPIIWKVIRLNETYLMKKNIMTSSSCD